MNSNKYRYIILTVAIILLIVDLIIADYSNFWTFGNLSGIIAMILLALAMIVSIRYENKQNK